MSKTLINNELAAFITSGMSITLASRNVDNIPSAARAKGCVLLHESPSRLRIFVSASQAAQLVADVKATGALSVTFSDPASHRTMQLKGFDARVCEMEPAENAAMEQYINVFSSRVEPLGFTAAYVRAFFSSPSDVVALEFSPTEAFQQTPGPNAGARL